MRPCLTKPRAARWTEPNEWQMKSKPREKQEKSKIIKWSLGARKHTSPNKGKTLESKTQSICSERGERSHMFLISPVAEQGEVMMKSSLSSGQVQLHWAVCMLNGFRLTNTHMHFHTFWCAIKKSTGNKIFTCGNKSSKVKWRSSNLWGSYFIFSTPVAPAVPFIDEKLKRSHISLLGAPPLLFQLPTAFPGNRVLLWTRVIKSHSAGHCLCVISVSSSVAPSTKTSHYMASASLH